MWATPLLRHFQLRVVASCGQQGLMLLVVVAHGRPLTAV